MKVDKHLTSVRISQPAKKTWERCARALSISQAAVLEIAIRDFALARGIKVDEEVETVLNRA